MAKLDLSMVLKWVDMYKYDRDVVALFIKLYTQYHDSGAAMAVGMIVRLLPRHQRYGAHYREVPPPDLLRVR